MVIARDPIESEPGWRSWRVRLRSAPNALRDRGARTMQVLSELMPKGLYARALIIIIAPIVVLESVIAFVFMERHWQAVTRRLSEATARNIAALVELYETRPAWPGLRVS